MMDYFDLALSLVKAQREEILRLPPPSLPPAASEAEQQQRERNDAIYIQAQREWFRKQA